MSQPRRIAAGSIVVLICSLALTTLSAQEPANGPQRAFTTQPSQYVIEVQKADGCVFAPIVSIVARRQSASGNAVQEPSSKLGVTNHSSLPLQQTTPEYPPSKASAENHGWLVYTLPRPARYLPDSFGRPIVSHLRVLARQTGELWNVKVVVGTGEFFDAGDHQVAELTLRTNERAEVAGVARFGLSPVRVGVLKVIGALADEPRVIFKTRTLHLEKLETSGTGGPYRVSLKNNSDKDVLAIQYNTYKDGKFLYVKWVENAPTQPLVKAGQSYKLEASSEDQTCGDPDGYRQSQSDSIVIATVVFADGSYEGDPGLAALIRGQALGNRDHLERVVATITNLSGDGEPSPAELAFHLKYLCDSLEEVATPYLVDSLRNGLPPTKDPDSDFTLGNFIRSGQHEIKSSLRYDAEQFERMSKSQNIEAVRAMSARVIRKYKEWLAASQAITSQPQ